MDRNGAFNATMALLKEFQGSNESEMNTHKVEDDAKRCVLLAVKVPNVINFEEVLDLDAIKYLQTVISLKTYQSLEKTRRFRLHESVHEHRGQLRAESEAVPTPDGRREAHNGGRNKEEAVRAHLLADFGKLEPQVLRPSQSLRRTYPIS